MKGVVSVKRRDKQRRPAKPTPAWLSVWQENMAAFNERAYRICYLVGTRSIRCWRAVVRFTRVLWRPLAHGIYHTVGQLLLRYGRGLKAEWRSLCEDFRHAGRRVHKKTTGRVKRILALPFLAIRRHRGVFRTVLNVTTPLVALVLLLQTVMYWRQAEFVLTLEYNGAEIGYIADESVYTGAAAQIEGLVIDEQDDFTVERSPKMTLTLADHVELMDEAAVRDALLVQAGNSLVHTSGLYVDGVFRGAMDRATLKSLMAWVLANNENPAAHHVDFFPQISITDGVYPAAAVCSEQEMLACLEALPIQSVHYETKTEPLAYNTVVIEKADEPLGYQKVKTRGKNGKQRVTEEVITVDGKERYRMVASTEVIKAPVDQVVEVGGQRYSEDAVVGDGKATGAFIWPLPYTKVISSPFASRWGAFHGAIDISNGSTHGKPIIASDGGVVEEADYHGSYGYYVLIDHGNGFKTRYAHCSKLMVEAGQKVAQGEYIANVGNTGYSFGAHLHFEIIKNGKLVDPLDYVQR